MEDDGSQTGLSSAYRCTTSAYLALEHAIPLPSSEIWLLAYRTGSFLVGQHVEAEIAVVVPGGTWIHWLGLLKLLRFKARVRLFLF